MAGLGEDRQAGVGQHAPEVEAGLQAGVVPVAADDQGRYVELLLLLVEVVERGPLALVVLHGVGGAGNRMLAELPDEVGEAAPVLLPEARARRAFGPDPLRRLLRIRLEPFVFVTLGAGADAGQGEGERSVGVTAAGMRRGKGALR